MLITGTGKLLPLHIPKTSHYSHYISLKNISLTILWSGSTIPNKWCWKTTLWKQVWCN